MQSPPLLRHSRGLEYHFVPPMASLWICLSIMGCSEKTPEHDGSDLRQISRQLYKCEMLPAAQQAEIPAAMFGIDEQMINNPYMLNVSATQKTNLIADNWPADLLTQAKAVVASLPPPILKSLIELHLQAGFRIGRWPLQQSIGGLATTGPKPHIIISSVDPMMIPLALRHELGHIVDMMLLSTGAKRLEFVGDKNAHFAVESASNPAFATGCGNSPGMPSGPGTVGCYSRTSAMEYFADAFDSYYCSPNSNQFIKDYLPKTYTLLQRFLPDPVWAPMATLKDTAKQGIFAALLAKVGSQEHYLLVAVEQEIAQVLLCPGKREFCTGTQTDGLRLKFHSAKNGKNYFATDRALDFRPNEQTMTISTFDAGDRHLKSRLVLLKSY